MIPTDREPAHPGEILLEEFLKPLDVTQSYAADRMGIPLNRLNEIVNGKRGVSADTAMRLSRVLGTSPEFWVNLQSNWDLYQAQQNLGTELASLTELTAPSALHSHGAERVRVRIKWQRITYPTGIRVSVAASAQRTGPERRSTDRGAAQRKQDNPVAA
jgi:antitoxin HigA-1